MVVSGVVVVAMGIVAFLASGGTGNAGGGPAAALANWAQSSGLGQDIGLLEADAAAVGRAARTGSSAMHTVCAAMADDAQNANGQLPSPDARVTQLLARAYGLEYDAAEACYRARGTGDPLLARSAADRASAKALFERALRRVRSVSGRSVATTTTTSPTTTATGFA